MGVLVSIDPGLREAGIAVFKDGVLKRAFLARNPEKKFRGPPAWFSMANHVSERLADEEVDTAVLETMRVYPRKAQQKGDPNDLIQVTGVEGWVAGVLGPKEAFGYEPREWKGQVPKDIHNERVLAMLTDAEKAAIEECPASLRHNVIDGIGIGLFHLGRLPT